MPRGLKQARIDRSRREVKRPTAGLCISMARLHARARGLERCSSHPPLYYIVQLYFQKGEKVSNNIAEYEGLIIGLKVAAALGVKRLTIKGNS